MSHLTQNYSKAQVVKLLDKLDHQFYKARRIVIMF